MKISSVNNFSVQNFKGLWGKTSKKTDIENVLCIPQITETKYYYPFADELPESVKEVINSRKIATIVEEGGHSKYRVFDCKLGLKFPFTEQQYDAYKKLPSNIKIDKNIKKIHLLVRDKYLNDSFGQWQIPAFNPRVEACTAGHTSGMNTAGMRRIYA